LTAPFPFAPGARVVANLSRALTKARTEFVEGGPEAAYGLRLAAITAVCDLSPYTLAEWEARRAEVESI
jgi:hypothetical protein